MSINESDLSNITDTYKTDTVNFPVTALLFESDSEVTITNSYQVSDGSESANGTFYGNWVSEAGISMPRDSHFVTIAIPNNYLTISQKLVVNWFNAKTQERGTVEYDVIVRGVPIT